MKWFLLPIISSYAMNHAMSICPGGRWDCASLGNCQGALACTDHITCGTLTCGNGNFYPCGAPNP